MRIISLNAWGGTLHAPLLAFLAGDQPDILCLQEVVHTPATTRDWLTYRDGDHVLPQRANLLAEVARALPDHAATFCPAARGDLWDGDTPVPSFWGLATFIHRAIPVTRQAQDFVHGAYGHDGYGPHPRSRSAHAVRVHDPASGRPISVTQMHGLRDLSGKHDTPARLEQAHRLRELSRRVTDPGCLAVICGDFNVTPDSATFALLTEDGFTDLVTTRGFPGTRTSHYTKPERHADYMLVNNTAAVRAFTVITAPEISDHCPLELEL
jgi:endonuclease/exonuclease/phosphatase family metal-dependent hydrolase